LIFLMISVGGRLGGRPRGGFGRSDGSVLVSARARSRGRPGTCAAARYLRSFVVTLTTGVVKLTTAVVMAWSCGSHGVVKLTTVVVG